MQVHYQAACLHVSLNDCNCKCKRENCSLPVSLHWCEPVFGLCHLKVGVAGLAPLQPALNIETQNNMVNNK